MAEKKQKVNQKTEQKKFDKEELAAIIEVQGKINEERQARIDKIIGHTFSDVLKEKSTGITRGERKSFEKKHDLDARNFHEFDADMKDNLLDFLIDERGIDGVDDISEGELSMWMELIIGRTLDPIAFEGK